MRRIGPGAPRNLGGVPAMVALALGGGCADPVPVATSIRISPESVVLEDVGGTAQLTASVLDQNDVAMMDIPVVWSSTANDIATVSEDGLVRGGAVGTTTVQASAGELTAVATIVVGLGEVGVLYKIHGEMGGDGWVNDRNWKTDAPLFRWYGVRTEDSMPARGVAELSLYGNGLTGELPPELGTVQTLRVLVLFGNRITGSIPPELGRLSDLEVLWIEENQLTGTIPSELGDLRNLRGLDLDVNALTGSIPSELGKLRNLVNLDLAMNELTGSIPPELGNFWTLQDLILRDNRLTGSIPPELGKLTRQLRHLDLSNNRLTGTIPPVLGDSLRLISLDLSGNELTGPIPGFRNMRRFNVSDNRLTGPIPGEFWDLHYLTDIDLSNNELTGSISAEIGDLGELNSLSIFGNPLTGPLPRELIGLPLSLFHWHDTDLCAPADDDFQEWLDSIEDHKGNGICDS